MNIYWKGSGMEENGLACPYCKFVSTDNDNQSVICPKCGEECIKVDYIDEKDIQAWHEEHT